MAEPSMEERMARDYLSPRERDTVLAALRCWQDVFTYGAPRDLEGLKDIASNNEQHAPLDLDEIDALCERINC